MNTSQQQNTSQSKRSKGHSNNNNSSNSSHRSKSKSELEMVRLVTLSVDKTIRVFDCGNYTCVQAVHDRTEYRPEDTISAMVWDPYRGMLLTAATRVRVWPMVRSGQTQHQSITVTGGAGAGAGAGGAIDDEGDGNDFNFQQP